MIEKITRAYLVCALWASTDEHGESLDAVFALDDFADSAVAQARADVEDFVSQADAQCPEWRSLMTPESLGNDLFLTRNGHGAGFWDRGHGETGETLTRLADGMGGAEFWADESGYVHQY